VTAVLKKYFLSEENIFFLKNPSRAFRPNFRHCPKNRTAQMLGGAAAPSPPARTPMCLSVQCQYYVYDCTYH